MIHEKERLTVGTCTMFANTIPVNVLFEKCKMKVEPEVWKAEQFSLIEVDGYYIFCLEIFHKTESTKVEYKCFTQKEDAFSYLEMYGFNFEKDEDFLYDTEY